MPAPTEPAGPFRQRDEVARMVRRLASHARLSPGKPIARASAMPETDRFTPEIAYTDSPRVACDGATEIPPALGHPRVYLQIDEKGFVDCGYCDKRFILKGGPADL